MKWAQRVLVCRKCDAIRLYVFMYECSLFFLFIIWWSFNIMFSIFFLRCSWHIITRICVQAKSYFCLKQSKNTFLLTNKKKEKQTTATILNENNAFAYNFHYLCACLPVNISPLWRIPREKKTAKQQKEREAKSRIIVLLKMI